jgi:hypothetical protein
VPPASQTARELPLARPLIAVEQSGRTVELESIGRSNRIRNYSHGHRRLETSGSPSPKPAPSGHATIDIPQLHNPNVRTNYNSKKFARKHQDKLRFNLSELNGKALISEDLLARPRSIEEANTEAHFRGLSERRKKSLPSRKSEQPVRRNGNQIRFEGLELKGHRVEEALEGDFLERIHNESKLLEATTRLGGNVYINNSINLFISRQPEPQTFVRGQVAPESKEGLTRRQMFLSRRRANNFLPPEDLL